MCFQMFFHKREVPAWKLNAVTIGRVCLTSTQMCVFHKREVWMLATVGWICGGTALQVLFSAVPHLPHHVGGALPSQYVLIRNYICKTIFIISILLCMIVLLYTACIFRKLSSIFSDLVLLTNMMNVYRQKMPLPLKALLLAPLWVLSRYWQACSSHCNLD